MGLLGGTCGKGLQGAQASSGRGLRVWIEVLPYEFGGSPEVFGEPRRGGRRVRVSVDHGNRPPLPVFLLYIPDPTLEPGKERGRGWRGSWLQPQDTPRKLVCLCACQRVNLPLGPCLFQASPLSSPFLSPLSCLPQPFPWAPGFSPGGWQGCPFPCTDFHTLPPAQLLRLPQFLPSADLLLWAEPFLGG